MSSLWTRGAHKLVHAIQDPRGSRNKAEISPEPTSFEDLYTRLKRNEITNLKLGFRESNFLGSKRYAILLEKALRVNTSVTAVSIGWRHHHCNHREALVKILRAIARHTRLLHLQLILNDWIPENLLRMLLHLQSDSLITIDIRSVHVLRKGTAALGWCCEQKSSWRRNCDHCVVSRILVHHLMMQHRHHPHLKSLHLVDCGLQDKHAVMLADYLHVRGGIAQLSVRSNRLLGKHGVAILCQAPVTQKLDLSLCDLDGRVGQALGPAIAARPWPLGELLLCGNYRMGTEALLALVHPDCCHKMVALNISYCDISKNRAVSLLDAMAKLDPSTSILREISMQGSSVANDMAMEALTLLLKRNLSLRVIRLNDPGSPKIINAQHLRMISTGIRENFEIEELYLDCLFTREIQNIWREIDFYLRLNRAGRRVFREIKTVKRIEPVVLPPQPIRDWFDVLEGAGDDLDVLYWIVRQSADRVFGFKRRDRQSVHY